MAVTKDQIKSTFQHFCKAFGFVISTGRPAAGQPPTKGLFLDYEPIYGGWEMRGYDGKGSGEYQPLGGGRLKAQAFYDAMWMAIRAVDAKKNRSKGTGL